MTEDQITVFYAITGLGWGVGSTLVEANANYEQAQRRNFPRLTDEALKEAWGFIWQVPEGTTGFHHTPSGLYWQFANEEGDANLKEPELSDSRQRVAYVGNVPEVCQTIDLKENTAMHDQLDQLIADEN